MTPLPCARARIALLLVLLAPLAAGAAAVRTSENDPRSYRALVLDNELKVILVSDPETDRAAASLSVAAGSGADPRDRPGLAHFLEHMLFLGTGKYPQPGEYKDFISRHGGSHNAYTAYDETNYFFDVEAGHLEPALDRFAQFFVAPLFNPEYVDRERHVVHSEFLGRRNDDRRRVLAAVQQAMNPDHPYSTFAVGNLETLADRPGSDLRSELIAFYRRHYSANLMALTVVGREPLDVLERWAREHFAAIENRDASPPVAEVPLFRPGTLPARLDVVPERESFSLSFRFPVPAVRPHWRAKPAVHLSHLLGHEGESSLLAELERRGWAQALSAGTGFDGERAATIDVHIRLTPQGAAHADEIAALLFAYLEVIRRDGVARWVFEENARLAAIDFRFAETAPPVRLASSLSRRQHHVPQEEVLRAPYAFDEWRPDRIRALLDALRPDNVLLTRVAPGLATEREAPWYGTPYRLEALDANALARWQVPPPGADALAMPAPNPFIPERLGLVDAPGGEVPEERTSGPGFRLWHLADPRFGLPRADFFFSLRSPVANDTPRHSVMTRLYVDLVNDALDAFAYPAELAGLSFRLYPHSRGLSVRISGYDDRQPVLLGRILEVLAGLSIDPRRFTVIKAEHKRGLENSRRDQPYARAMRRLRDLVVRPDWTLVERLAVIDPITRLQLERHARRLFERVQVVALANGNLDAVQAGRMGTMVHDALVAPATPVEVPRARVVRLRRGDRLGHELRVPHPESALVTYYQGPDKSLRSRALAGLLVQVLDSPFFETLRTQKKLGYVVSASAYPILDTAGLVFLVQSPVASAATLQLEVRSFLDEHRRAVERMDGDDFEQHKRALIARVMEEERQLGDRSERFWEEIDRGNLAFDTRERLAAAIESATIEELRAFYAAVLDGRNRRELAVRADGEATPRTGPLPGEQPVTAAWTRRHRGLLPG